MKKETYKAQQPFAGEKKPSMLRCCVKANWKPGFITSTTTPAAC